MIVALLSAICKIHNGGAEREKRTRTQRTFGG